MKSHILSESNRLGFVLGLAFHFFPSCSLSWSFLLLLNRPHVELKRKS